MSPEESVEELVEKGYLTAHLGKHVLKLSKEEGVTPEQVCDKHGYWLCNHNPEIDRKIDQEIDRAIKTSAVKSSDSKVILGKVMSAIRGQANPNDIRERILKELARRSNMSMNDLAIEDIKTVEDNRVLKDLRKRS